MRLGSVILKVEPRQVADRMWYFPLLKPYHDHIPVKADLSDLEEKIQWCREHDAECKQIGINAMKFYEKYVARTALLDYVEMVCKQIAVRYVDPPAWWSPPTREQEPPKFRKPDVLCYEDRRNPRMSRLCTRCQEDEEAERRELEDQQNQQAAQNESRAEKRARLKMRMRKKAKEG